MNIALPDDLLAFLRAGSELRYDVKGSEIGRIKLKRDVDLDLTTITTFPGCQSIIDDPYDALEGLYQIDVVDLVAEFESYGTEGLLCWIVALQRFGSIDPEHGDVITFPGVTWTELAASPLRYLEAQWNHELGERVLPWLHFPFKFSDVDVLLAPYGTQCPVHGVPLAAAPTQKPDLFDIMRCREPDDWLQVNQAEFLVGACRSARRPCFLAPLVVRQRTPGPRGSTIRSCRWTRRRMPPGQCNAPVADGVFALRMRMPSFAASIYAVVRKSTSSHEPD